MACGPFVLKTFLDSTLFIKFWVFFSGMHLCLNFEAESETTKGTNFKLVCSIDQSSFTGQVISLLKDGSSKSTCDNANNCLPFDSDSGRYKYSSNASSVTVEISVANHLTDSGNWKCKLGVIKEQDYELVVKSKYKNKIYLLVNSDGSKLFFKTNDTMKSRVL